ncbi:MAG TPA: hypothetical protein VF654_16710, partial [Pyrinomonadaceae bacterium]
MASRPLKGSEVELARQVFEDNLPYDKVHLSNRFFPFNEGTAVTAASPLTFIPVRTLRSYTIFVGPDVHRDGADGPLFRDTFIHELTHVWQGYHGLLGWAYMAQSMLAQGYAILTERSRHKAYTYEAGAPWESYNVEQQASIVQGWFRDGMRTEGDKRYAYIVNHIR